MGTVLGLAAAAVIAAAPDPAAVDAIEITGRRAVVGTLQQGLQAFRPEFFTPARPGTAMDMIQWLPGFTFEETRDLRGLGGSGGNVLIDGRPPTSKNDTLATVLRRIPADQVERVEMIVGGAPGIDMRGHAVIANVVLKRAGAPRGATTAGVTVMQDGRVAPDLLVTRSRNAGGRASELSLQLSQRIFSPVGVGDGTVVRLDGQGRALFTGDVRAPADGPLVAAAASYEIPFQGGRLRANGSLRLLRGDLNETARLSNGELQTLDLINRFEQGELGLRWERALSPSLNLETQALQRLNWNENDIATRRPPVVSDFMEDSDQQESVVRATLRFKKSDRLTLEGSAEAAYNRLNTDSRLVGPGVLIIPAAAISIEEERGEAGGLLTWVPSPRFSLTAGLKAETSTLRSTGDTVLERSLSYVKPRTVVTWAPVARTQIRLRVEREVGQISLANFIAFSEYNTGVVRAGNPDIRPQQTWIGEATMERQFWEGGSAVVTLRRREIQDVVDVRLTPSGATQVGNIGDGSQTDLVSTLTVPLRRMGLSGLMLKGSLTLSRTRVTDPTTGERRRFTQIPSVQGDAHLTYDMPERRLTVGLDAFYGGRLIVYRPGGNEYWGAYPRLSAFVEYRWTPNLNLRLEAQNLLDATPDLTIERYAGARLRSALLYTDTRDLGVGPYVHVRVRKTLQ